MRKQCDERYFAPTPQRDAMLVVDAVASRRRPPPDCGDALVALADARALVCAGDGGRVVATLERRVESTRRATLDDDDDDDGWTTRHVAFFGASPCARLASTRDGAIAARRDGAIAAWRRDGGGALRGTTTPPYAGAPPIVAEGTKAARDGTGESGARVGDCFGMCACEGSDGTTYAATASAAGDGDAGRVAVRVVGGAASANAGETVASATYEGLVGVVSAGGEDFWVTTRSGVLYRWNCRLRRATARVDARGATRDGGMDGGSGPSRALLTSVSFPDRALVCADVDAERAFVVLPALGAPGERRDDDDVAHAVEEVCAFGRVSATKEDEDGQEMRAGERAMSIARHGAFLWVASFDAASERRLIRVFHASTGALVDSATLPELPRAASESHATISSQEHAFELVNGGVAGMYARAYSPGALAPVFRCSLHVPSALSKVVEPILMSTTLYDLEHIDKVLADVEMYGASKEALARALITARREVETATEAFKTKRDARLATRSRDVRASCAIAPALLLKARLDGRFDEVAAARWNFAVREALETLERASADCEAFSRQASASVHEARDILLTDWDALRATGGASQRDGVISDDVHLSGLVRELESSRGENLPAYAWVGARALLAFRDGAALATLIDAVWGDKPLLFPQEDESDAKVAIEELVTAMASRVDASETPAPATVAFAPFEATTHLLYRIAPQCAVAFIDATCAVTPGATRVALAKRALTTIESPSAHLGRFADGAAADALVRAVAETLCAADLTRSGVYIALTFGGLFDRSASSPTRTLAQRGKTTLTGWVLAHEIVEAEIERRRDSIDDARKFAAEAFELMSKSFRTLIEDWNDMPLRQSPEEVDVDVAAEFMLRTADAVRTLFAGDAEVELKSPVLDIARRHTTTMTDACAAMKSGDDAASDQTVDSLERLIVAVTSTLRSTPS